MSDLNQIFAVYRDELLDAGISVDDVNAFMGVLVGMYRSRRSWLVSLLT